MGGEQSSRREERNNREVREYERAIEERLRQHEQRMQNRVVEKRVTITAVVPPAEGDAASKKDVEKALEDQRKLYEQKMKVLLQKRDGGQTSTSSSQQKASAEKDAALKRDLEKALEEQRQLYELKMKNLLDMQQGRATDVQQAAVPQATVQQAAMQQQSMMQQAATQQAAMQQAAAQQVFAQQAFAQQTFAQQAAAQQAAAQQAAAHQAAAQQAAAHQSAAQQAAAQQAAQQQAAQQAAAQLEAARQAAAQQAAAQQAAAQQSAALQARVQAIATESMERIRTPYRMTRADLRETFSINKLYPHLDAARNRTPSPKPPASTSGGSGANKKQDDFVFVNFKDTHQNVQRATKASKNEEDDITCPTCGGRYGERIYQCGQGHSSCHSCKMRQVRCNSCRQPLTELRNYTLEKYVAERRVQCPNADDGCRLYIKMSLIEAHAKECPFKEMQCPCLGPCAWTGKLHRLSGHFDDKHPSHRQGDVDKELFLPSITADSHTMHLVKLGNFNFLFHLKVLKQRVNMVIQLIGTKQSASKWFYEVHVYNKREPRRKFQYTDRCSSNRDSVQQIIDSAKCAVLPLEYANTYFTEGALAYKFYIKKEEIKEDKDELKKIYVKDDMKKPVFNNRRGRGRGGKRNI